MLLSLVGYVFVRRLYIRVNRLDEKNGNATNAMDVWSRSQDVRDQHDSLRLARLQGRKTLRPMPLPRPKRQQEDSRISHLLAFQQGLEIATANGNTPRKGLIQIVLELHVMTAHRASRCRTCIRPRLYKSRNYRRHYTYIICTRQKSK